SHELLDRSVTEEGDQIFTAATVEHEMGFRRSREEREREEQDLHTGYDVAARRAVASFRPSRRICAAMPSPGTASSTVMIVSACCTCGRSLSSGARPAMYSA